jgi:hypothetical protein
MDIARASARVLRKASRISLTACPFEHFYQPAVLSEQGDEFGHGQAGLADDATQFRA